MTDQPSLIAVGDAGVHRSACWLPVAATGLGEAAEALRKRAVGEGRHDAAVKVAEEIAKRPEAAEGSVIA
jgi:hypothetical protein